MLIYFLRHGDASSDSRLHDSERPLTDLGVRQATRRWHISSADEYTY